jgi:hypothetical protein
MSAGEMIIFMLVIWMYTDLRYQITKNDEANNDE